MLRQQLVLGMVLLAAMCAFAVDGIASDFGSGTEPVPATGEAVVTMNSIDEKSPSPDVPAQDSSSDPDERQAQIGNRELIANGSGKYVVITDPESGIVEVLNLSRFRGFYPELAMPTAIPRQDAWGLSLADEGLLPALSSGPGSQPMPLSTAGKIIITTPGVYMLTSDYAGSDQVAVDIQCSDVVIYGNGHSITGVNPPSFSTGIQINGAANVKISNVSVSGFDYGIEIPTSIGAKDCVISDSNIYDNDFYGINLAPSCSNITITNNLIFANGFDGIFIFSGGDNKIISNIITGNIEGIEFLDTDGNHVLSNYILGNYFDSVQTDDSENIFIDNLFLDENYFDVWTTPGKNTLNETTPSSGANIIGGSLIGGNFWGFPNASGFSQTATDSDNNGICDTGYTVFSGNRDSFPLAPGKTMTVLTLNAPANAYCMVSYELSGRLTRQDGTGIGNALIVFTCGGANPWTVTDNNGYYTLSVTSGMGSVGITASFPGSSVFRPSLSPKRTVNVVSQGKPLLISLAAPDTIPFGQQYLVSGSATSNGSGVSLTLIPEASWDGTNWNAIFPAITFTSGSSGHFEWNETITSSTSARRYIRVRFSGNCYYASGTSPVEMIRFIGAGLGTSQIGSFRSGTWYLDSTGNGAWNTGDKSCSFGLSTDKPVTGDWNRNGKTEIGVFRSGKWYLDYNGDGVWSAGDKSFSFGKSTDTPVSGDWNKDGKTEIGVFRSGMWYLDSTGDGVWNAGDKTYAFGKSTDRPVTGDWNNDGKTEIGVFRSGTWYLDYNSDGVWSAGDKTYKFGLSTDSPVTGDWNDDGKTEIGVFRSGTWYLDYSGNGAWGSGDWTYSFGKATDIPVSGHWA